MSLVVVLAVLPYSAVPGTPVATLPLLVARLNSALTVLLPVILRQAAARSASRGYRLLSMTFSNYSVLATGLLHG